MSSIFRLSVSFFLLCFPISGILAQKGAPIDSLKQNFLQARQDSARWRIAQDIVYGYAFIQTDSALHWAQKAMSLAEKMGHPDILGKSHFELGLAYANKRDYSTAMQQYLKAIEMYEGTGNQKGLNETKVEIAMIYIRTGEHPKAKPYLDEAYAYFREEVDTANIIYTLGYYQIYFSEIESFDSLLYYSHEILNAAERFNQKRNLARIYSNLAGTYLFLKDLPQAKLYIDKRAAMGFEEDERGLFFHYYILSEYFFKADQPDSTLFYAEKALEQARRFSDLGKETDAYMQLIKASVKKEDYESAFIYLDLKNEVEDSLDQIRYQENLAELTVQYETQQKEAEIARQQLQIQEEVNRRNFSLAVGLMTLVLAVGLFLYFQARMRIQKRQNEMELQLKNSEADQLRRLDQVKSAFFANISHEFRTPLTLILNPLKQIVDGTFNGDLQKTRQIMLVNADRLLRLVNQMLDLARLESGALSPQKEPMDLVQVTKSVVLSFESWPSQKQIHFQTEFPSEPLAAWVDADKLEKILVNLLSNAFKFTPAGGRVYFRMQIVERKPEEVKVRFEVQDNGTGISPEQLPHIFDRFYSGAGHQDGVYSSGIGLALTKELVSWYGGEIEVNSQLGAGTTFQVFIPFAIASDAQLREHAPIDLISAPEENSQGLAASRKSKKPVVLVVEDNPDLRTYISNQLRGDYQVEMAGNGQMGLDQALELIPDLILSDVMMPDLDGLAFCKQVKQDERTSHVPVILLTALAEQKEKLAGLSSGADAYLTKPFDPEELQILVRNLIEQRQMLRKKFALSSGPHSSGMNPHTQKEAAFLEKIEKVVMQELDNAEFSIEDLGRAVHMSRSQLHRKVKALTDLSPSALVRSIRLREAYRLLEGKQGNISQVAFEVGIPNLPYFSRSFHDQFGFPPSELLRK